MAATGNGSSVTFAASGSIGTITSISGIGGSRESLDVTHLGSTGGRDFIPNDTVDFGELSIEGHWNGTLAPIASAAETVTITISSSGGTKSWAGTAFATSWETSAPLDDLVSYSLTLKSSGDWAVS